jgi:hypothetical protein
MSLYAIAGKIVYNVQIEGIIVDGAQIAQTFTRFLRGVVPRTESGLEEWYFDLGQYIATAELYAAQNYWPMNDKACGMYGGCPFRKICGLPPSVRHEWLRADFTKRIWDPLKVRGDI